MSLTKTEKTKVKRTPKRASYDRDLLNTIIDSIIIGHISFNNSSGNHSIPMPFWRDGDFMYCHCSVNSRLINLAQPHNEVCISFAIVDGLVFAKSAFHHCMNYRSAVVYGQFEIVNSDDDKCDAMKKFIDLLDKNRWDMIRKPNKKELNATTVLRIPLQEAVTKVRVGPPLDKDADKKLDTWSGVIPYYHTYGDPKES